MSTETKKTGRAVWLLPLFLALPFLAAGAFLIYRFGPELAEMINVLIKTAVVS